MEDDRRLSDMVQRFCQEKRVTLPPPCTQAAFERFAARTSVPVPPPLRSWLLKVNGAAIGAGYTYGIECDRENEIEFLYSLRPEWAEKAWLPIANDGCGNHYLIPTKHEYGPGYPVFFVDTSVAPNEPDYLCASSINLFFLLLLEWVLDDTDWPFDKEFTLRRDPEFLKFTGIRYPWDLD